MSRTNLNLEDLELVRLEVESSYTREEITAFKSFEEFFEQVIIQNGYNEAEGLEKFNEEYWRPYYFNVWVETVVKAMRDAFTTK